MKREFPETGEVLHTDDDGYFLLENRDGNAYLSVFPPSSKNGKRVSLQEVIHRLELLSIPYRMEDIRIIVEKADGEWHSIGTWEEPESRDASFSIFISEDKKTAYIEITPPVYKGKWITEESIYSALKEKGIVAGIKNDVIAGIAARNLPELQNQTEEKKTFLIAESIPPQPPENGRIKFYFPPFPRAKPEENPQGKVDFRSLNVIQVCKSDEILAELIPPKEGKEGMDIFGNSIPSPQGKPATLEPGENTELRENKLYSLREGHVKIHTDPDFTRARIHVVPVLELENVDFSTGNIRFPGTVHVKNRVLDNFEIEAGEDIIIEKSVSNVKLVSGGDVILYGGILGRGSSIVSAEGNVYARFIQNSIVHAKKSVYVEDLILHSEVVAEEEIHILQGRGELIGGRILCGNKIYARRIGSVAEPHTLIYTGIPPEVLMEINKINLELEKNRKLLSELEKNQKYLEGNPRKLKEEKYRTYYEKLKLAVEKVSRKVQSLQQQKDTLIHKNKIYNDGEVKCTEILFPNVEIVFGNQAYKYRQTRTPLKIPCTLKYDVKERTVKILYH